MCAISENGLPVCDRCGGLLDLMEEGRPQGAASQPHHYEGMVCENCGKVWCSDCLGEMTPVEREHCPACDFHLVPLSSGNLPQ